MLAGECPNAGLSSTELMARAIKGVRIRDIRELRPKLPDYMVRFLRRMTDPNPDRRFATPDEALRYLNEWKQQEERKFRLFLIWTLSLTAVVLAAILYFGIRWIRSQPVGVPPQSVHRQTPSSPSSQNEFESEFSIPNSVKRSHGGLMTAKHRRENR